MSPDPSHAAPEDNAFTLWLGAKLAALGYEVWADVLRLRGGDDWQRKLEHALRHRAAKVLLVANPRAVDKQGVRNEVQIASDVAGKIGDQEFIIPLRLAAFEAPFLIAHAQYIDFQRGWAAGLAELLNVLDETYKVPRQGRDQSATWREVQLVHGRAVTAPFRHVRVISRLIFTEDGQKPFEDAAKMHRLRRSFAKTWRNARWRDMLLAFLHWLADGGAEWRVPVSSDEALVLRLPPVTWMAPVSMPLDAEVPEMDDDDPSDDDEVDEFEEEDGSDAEDDQP